MEMYVLSLLLLGAVVVLRETWAGKYSLTLKVILGTNVQRTGTGLLRRTLAFAADIEDRLMWDRGFTDSLSTKCPFLTRAKVFDVSDSGSHSLKYFYTVMSGPGLAKPRFITVTYVDDQLILSFDSYRDSESQSTEPRTPWMEHDYWEREIRISREKMQVYRMCLQKVSAYYNHSEGGVHTFQRLSGCEVFSNRSFSRGFVQYAYDGQDYLALDTETLHWIAGNSGALNHKREWEEKQSFAKYWKGYLEGECVYWLQRYLDNGKETLLRTDLPSVQVTRHTSSDGEVTLRCRAHGFYPSEISLDWLKDGEEQLQETELIETRPAGDGTFQKWAAVGMLSGNEQKYTCRVQHEGLPEPLFLKWEPQSSITGNSAGVITALLLFLASVIVGVVIWRKNTSDRKRGSYTTTASSDSAQG